MTIRRLFVALFILALFTIAVRETLDPDMWWHLRTGEYILEQGIPRQDVFSFTVQDHTWITHEWLSQVFMWLVYTAGGLPGLMVVFAALIALSYWLVYVCCEGRPFLATFVVLLAAVASALTWGARPQMFNILLMAAFVYIVEGVKAGRFTSRAFWWLPPLTVLWVNLHSGYLLGVVLLATYVAGDAGQRWFFRPEERTLPWRALRLLAIITGLSFLAALINPNGPVLWLYPFETLGSSAMQTYIQEWQPPDFHFSIFWPFGAMLALGVLGWTWGRSPSLSELLLFLGTGAAGLLSVRHIPLFTVVAAPIVARSWWAWLQTTRVGHSLSGPPPRTRPVISALNWLLLIMAAVVVVVWTAGKIAANEPAIAAQYPVAAVDYLEQEGLADRPGYNSYGWGGYLIWRGLPVFVDGRADVYGDPFLFYYRQTFDVADNWQEPLDEYDVAYILMGRDSPLTTLLAVSNEWREAYSDDLAQIFIRAETTPP